LDARNFKRAEDIPRFEEVNVRKLVGLQSVVRWKKSDLEACGTAEGGWMQVEVDVWIKVQTGL